MPNTTSIRFPKMFDTARNRVSVYKDDRSVVNRSRLLILTEPTELYNSPTFGVGLKRYLWQYNTPNTKALVQERIKQQLDEFEPCVVAQDTQFADGLLFTEGPEPSVDAQDYNRLKMTVGLRTIFGDELSIDMNWDNLQDKIDFGQSVYKELMKEG